jgi:hypothetical protein
LPICLSLSVGVVAELDLLSLVLYRVQLNLSAFSKADKAMASFLAFRMFSSLAVSPKAMQLTKLYEKHPGQLTLIDFSQAYLSLLKLLP